MESKEYSSFIKNLNLEKIYIKSLKVVRQTVIDIENISLQFELEEVISHWDKGENQVRYEVRAEIVGTSDKDQLNKAFHIDILIEVIYSLNTDIEVLPEFLEIYEKNAVFNVWPYLRNTVSDISHRMDLELPLIPLFKI